MTANELQPGRQVWTYLDWQVVQVTVRNKTHGDRWYVDTGREVHCVLDWFLYGTQEEAALAMFEAAKNTDQNLTAELAETTARRDRARVAHSRPAAGHLGEKT